MEGFRPSRERERLSALIKASSVILGSPCPPLLKTKWEQHLWNVSSFAEESGWRKVSLLCCYITPGCSQLSLTNLSSILLFPSLSSPHLTLFPFALSILLFLSPYSLLPSSSSSWVSRLLSVSLGKARLRWRILEEAGSRSLWVYFGLPWAAVRLLTYEQTAQRAAGLGGIYAGPIQPRSDPSAHCLSTQEWLMDATERPGAAMEKLHCLPDRDVLSHKRSTSSPE